MTTCAGCKFARWDKTAAGRLHPSGNGRRGYEYKIKPLPAAMYWIGGEPSPAGGAINRREPLKRHCPYYAREE